MSRAIIRVVVLLMAAMIVVGAIAGSARAASGPVITQLTCVSSVGVATLTDVMPASTQVATLSAASGDNIRCQAVIAGEYTSLQWRGPNDDTGWQTTFVTSVGAPRQGGAPYDIGLTVNWDGNPVMAHVSVLPDSRAQVVTITAQPGCFLIPGSRSWQRTRSYRPHSPARSPASLQSARAQSPSATSRSYRLGSRRPRPPTARLPAPRVRLAGGASVCRRRADRLSRRRVWPQRERYCAPAAPRPAPAMRAPAPGCTSARSPPAAR